MEIRDGVSLKDALKIAVQIADALAAGTAPAAMDDATSFAYARHLLWSGRVGDALPALSAATRYVTTNLHPSEGIGFLEQLVDALVASPTG